MNGFDALLGRDAARHGEDAARHARSLAGIAAQSRERRPHLAAGAENQDVPFERAHRGDISIGRAGQFAFEIDRISNFEPRHKINRTPSRRVNASALAPPNTRRSAR